MNKQQSVFLIFYYENKTYFKELCYILQVSCNHFDRV